MLNLAGNPKKLSKIVDYAFGRVEAKRKGRLRMLKQFVGRFEGHTKSGSDEDSKASPINLMYHAVRTYVPNLVYKTPEYQLSSRYLMFRPYASDLELALNHLIKDEIKLDNKLRRAVTDAIFFAGFMKTGICDSGHYISDGAMPVMLGKPFADTVDPDDIVIDPLARNWQEQSLVGNRYRVPKDYLLESGLVDPDAAERLTSRYDHNWRKEASSLTHEKDTAGQLSAEMEYVDLVDIYLPHESVIVTLPWMPGGTVDEALRIADYDGPDTGPYHMLGFTFAPDNLLPVAPAGIWYDIHVLANRLARKMARAAERKKSVLAYEPSAAQDAQEIVDSEDGESVRVDDVDAIKELEFGGASEESYEHMEWLKKQFQEISGNVDMLAGTAADTPTLGQSEMLQANSSVVLSDSQQSVYNFVECIGKDLMFHLHTDPLIELPLVKRVQGVDQQIIYSPEMREGEWLDYSIKCKPMSMARTDPNMQARRIMEFAQAVIPALAQAYQLLGPAFNIEKALVTIGQKLGIDELDELINSPMLMMQLQSQMMMPDGNAGKKMLGAPAGAMPGGGRPQQPNPGQMGPSGGMDPMAERNAASQEAGAEVQRGRPAVQQVGGM